MGVNFRPNSIALIFFYLDLVEKFKKRKERISVQFRKSRLNVKRRLLDDLPVEIQWPRDPTHALYALDLFTE